jgi:cytochrome c-type biogenesis protein CcmH/NrfG
LARSEPSVPATCPAHDREPLRRRIAWLAGLFFLGLFLRLAHFLTILDSPYFPHVGLDPLAYDHWGMRIAAGDWLGERIFYQDPLYPYFLGLVYWLAGHQHKIVIVLQCALGALISPLVYDATRRWFGAAEAAASGLLAAVYLPAVYYEGLILKTWLGAFLVAAGLWTLAHALSFPARWRPWWAASGLFLGLACLVRGNVLLFLPLLAVWVALDHSVATPRPSTGGPAASASPPPSPPSPPRTARPWTRLADRLTRRSVGGRRLRWQAVASLLLGAAVVLGATAARNRYVGGEWVLTTSQGGQNFHIGNNPANRNGRYDPLPFVGANPKHEERGFAAEARRRTGREMSPTEISRYWFAESFRWMRQRPGDWLRLVWLKFRNFWGAYEVPDNLDYYLYRREAPVLRLPLAGFGLVAPLALLGAALAWRRPAWPRALLIFALVYSSSVVLFFVFSRYRLPMMPAIFPFAGYGLMELARRLRAWRRKAGAARPALVAASLTLALAAFVNLPVHAPVAHWTYRAAERLGLPRVAESTSIGHYNLGLAFAARAEADDDPDELRRAAAEQFREALRQEPGKAKPYAELGKVLARLEENRAAIEAYQVVIRLEPHRPRPHHVLGILHRREGDLPAAEAAFRRALQLDPTRLDSATDLGEVLLAQGRRQEAATAFRLALRLAPDHQPARQGLAAAEGRP